MCYWSRQKPKTVHENVSEDEPIIAYKRLNKTKWDIWFVSPCQGYTWRKNKAVARRPKNFPTNHYVGIFAFKALKRAQEYDVGSIVVKVALWGTVVEYSARSGNSASSKNYAGYRATNAKILAHKDPYYHKWIKVD